MTDLHEDHQDPEGVHLAVREEDDDPEALIGDDAPDELEES